MVPNFVVQADAEAMAAEASALEHKAFFTNASHNLFLETPIEDGNAAVVSEGAACTTPPGAGPSGITSVGSIATDYLCPAGPLLSLYSNQHFVDFISKVVLGKSNNYVVIVCISEDADRVPPPPVTPQHGLTHGIPDSSLSKSVAGCSLRSFADDRGALLLA